MQTHLNALLPQPREDRVCPSTYRPILALQNQPDGTRLVRVDGVSVTGKEGDDDTRAPRRALTMSTADAIADTVLDGDAVDHRGRDEELVFDVYEVFGHLDG